MDTTATCESALIFIERCFGSKPSRISAIVDGVASVNYWVELSRGPYIVRVDYRRSLHDVTDDIAFMALARSRGIPAPCGPFTCDDVNGCPILCRPAVKGTVLSERGGLSREKAVELGGWLARIHQISGRRERMFFYPFLNDAKHASWEWLRDGLVCASELGIEREVNEAFQDLHRVVECFGPLDVAGNGLMHGDFRLNNIVISDDESLTILDWEKACFGPVLWDYGLAMFHALWRPMKPRNDEMTKAFFQGYWASSAAKNYPGMETISDIIKCVGAAWFLKDLRFFSLLSVAPSAEIGLRRRKYFFEYSLPVFKQFWAEKGEIREVFADSEGRIRHDQL